MSPDCKYRVVRKKITRGRNGPRYYPGDTIEPTEAELSAFGDNLEPIESDTETPPEDEDNSDESEICGIEMSNGEQCERLVGECPYHDTYNS